MRRNKAVVWWATLVVSGILAPPAAAVPTPREIAGSELLVLKYLETLDLPSGRIQHYQEPLLNAAFPDDLFFVVVYPRSAAGNLPESLRLANLFAVDPDGRVKLLSTSEAIVQLFRVRFNPAKTEGRCREAVQATLLLLRATYPEYKFALTVEDLKITLSGKNRIGTGKLLAKEGGTGALAVKVTLDSQCVPIKIVETATLTPAQVVFTPPTPAEISAAAKIVRTYVTEQKLSVDPVKYIDDLVLVRLFPGRLLFLAPLEPVPGKETKNILDVIVVGPSGKVERLFGTPGAFMPWVNSMYGPATTDPRRREGLDLVVRLFRLRNPGFTFKTTTPPEITADPDGTTTLTSRTPAVNPNGRHWVLEIRIKYGRRGRVAAWWWGWRPANA